ncbi:hypothetical protein DWY01_08500 [Eubacterium sp. AF22-8LB]|nr:hypothetical protein DWY01_08500 [Eubacterium sp. AF22-8LB]
MESCLQKAGISFCSTNAFIKPNSQCEYICRHGYRTLGPDWCTCLV